VNALADALIEKYCCDMRVDGVLPDAAKLGSVLESNRALPCVKKR
jgi:hypothetical protein